MANKKTAGNIYFFTFKNNFLYKTRVDNMYSIDKIYLNKQIFTHLNQSECVMA